MNCPKLKLRGLMTILKAGTAEDERKESFQHMYKLYQKLQQTYGEQIDTLSMGMSGDMRQAVLEGANMVRIGTAIFGERES
jgi:Predicted enzyme with a TIM-barrel fold